MNLESAKLIIDTQFGSTGKGLIAGYLASRDAPDTVITAWGSNAGHTYIGADGRKFVHIMLANGIVSPNLKQILIGPGSYINPDILLEELDACDDLVLGRGVKLLIHPHAAVITQKHIDEEAGPMTKIGSTKKGVGAAMIDRIRRNPDDNNVAKNALRGTQLDQFVVSVNDYNRAMDEARVVQIEGAQGYSLSMYHGLYPYTTSRDVTPAQIFADCAVPMSWWSKTEVVGTVRSFPIRVANRFDDQGQQVGYSGGCYPDQHEIQWQDLGLTPELTTVTRLPRRIFTFSQMQLEEAMRQCATDSLFLNFVNYCRDERELLNLINAAHQAVIKTSAKFGICYLGFGPTDADVMEVFEDTTFEEIAERWKATATYPLWVKGQESDARDHEQSKAPVGLDG